jgi:hypothetical protein
MIDLILLILCCAGIVIAVVFTIVMIVVYKLVQQGTADWNRKQDEECYGKDLEEINNSKFKRNGM